MVAGAWTEDQTRVLSLCWPLLLSAGAGERVGVLCCPLSATGLLGAPGLMRWEQLRPGLLAPPGVGEVWRRVPERELFPRLLLHAAPPASTSPPSRLDTRPSLALSGALGEGLTFSSSLPGLSSSRARLPAPAVLCLPAAPPLGHVHPPISVRPPSFSSPLAPSLDVSRATRALAGRSSQRAMASCTRGAEALPRIAAWLPAGHEPSSVLGSVPRRDSHPTRRVLKGTGLGQLAVQDSSDLARRQ